jgi:hypothetical protein
MTEIDFADRQAVVAPQSVDSQPKLSATAHPSIAENSPQIRQRPATDRELTIPRGNADDVVIHKHLPRPARQVPENSLDLARLPTTSGWLAESMSKVTRTDDVAGA